MQFRKRVVVSFCSVRMLQFAILFVVCLFMSSTSSENVADISAPQVWRQQMLQNLLQGSSFGRESDLKRAYVRQIPPGFVGVRGKRSEKSKAKDPVPGFLGVRGKKALTALDHNADTLHRYIQRELSKLEKSF